VRKTNVVVDCNTFFYDYEGGNEWKGLAHEMNIFLYALKILTFCKCGDGF
jgi:hypothetical protein